MREYQIVKKPVKLWKIFLLHFFGVLMVMLFLIWMELGNRGVVFEKNDWMMSVSLGVLFAGVCGGLRVFQTKRINSIKS